MAYPRNLAKDRAAGQPLQAQQQRSNRSAYVPDESARESILAEARSGAAVPTPQANRTINPANMYTTGYLILPVPMDFLDLPLLENLEMVLLRLLFVDSRSRRRLRLPSGARYNQIA